MGNGNKKNIINKIQWKFNQQNVDWEKLSELYRIAPLGNKSADYLQTVFTNSMYKCFVLCDDQLIAAGRALADGADCAYICDIAVRPEFQNIGIGKSIVLKLASFTSNYRKIILYSNPGKEGFYQKLGFRRMNTAMAIFSDNEKAIKDGLISE